jgi:hypothetical protein
MSPIPIGVASAKFSHFFRLIGDGAPVVTDRSGRLHVDRRSALPARLRPIIAARVAAGGSLRSLATEYGVSREAIRRAVTRS